MTPQQAKEILLLHRPDVPEAPDAELASALALVQRDAELRAWFESHCAFQRAMRERMRSVAPPAGLRERLSATRKVVRPPTWIWTRITVAAAAALAVALVSLRWFSPPAHDRFADYRSRMVSQVLRSYHMDIVTNDMAEVRSFMASRGAPADYQVSGGLARLQLSGGGLMRWRGHQVSMVCFDRGDQQMLYLFVMRREAVGDAPPARPQETKVNRLITTSWTEGDNTYVLAGPEEPDFTQKYRAQ